MNIEISSLYPSEPCVTRLGVDKRKTEYQKAGKFDKLPEVVKVEEEWMVLHGHHRVMALKELGHTAIRVLLANVDSVRQHALTETLYIRKYKNQRGFMNYRANCDTSGRIELTAQEKQLYQELRFMEQMSYLMK